MIPSDRALIILLPTAGSLAQRGTSPQRSGSRWRAPVSGCRRTTSASWVGARFQLGGVFGTGLTVSK